MRKESGNFFAFVFLTVLFSFFICACNKTETAPAPLTIHVIKGPSAVALIRLFEDPPEINGFDVKMEALAHADLVAARLLSGEARIGILPPNMAAKIASSGKDLRVAAVTGGGNLRLLTTDPAVRSLEDLKGGTVEAAGQGATPDYIFRRILSVNGISPDTDVKIGYSLAHPEIAQSLVAGKISTALLPEPFATMALLGRPDIFSVVDVQHEWIMSGGEGNYPMTVLVVDGVFASANKSQMAEIIRAVKESIEWVVSNPEEAGILAEKHELGLKAGIVKAAIPSSGYTFISAEEARPALEALFTLFLENSPASIGGVLPPDEFYYR